MTNNNLNNGLIWITGFSASGKTTVSRKVRSALHDKGLKTIFLDGDDLRAIFGNNWGFDKGSRVELAHVYFRLCSHLSTQGFVVIISAVAMFDSLGDWISENVPNSMQVYLKVPKKVRLDRDAQTKKIFLNSKLNDDDYDVPKYADLTISNHGHVTPDEAANKIVCTFLEKTKHKLDRGRGPHWNSYYESNIAPIIPSSFAKSVASQLLKNQEILEIGCGNGRDAAFFASSGFNVTAIDRSESAIKYCREKYSNHSVCFYEGMITDSSPHITNVKYDIIYSRFVIHAMPLEEEIEVLSAANNLLKTGGRLYIECRSINDPLARRGEIISITERIDGHYRRFIILDEFRERLINTGFKIIEEVEANGLAVYKDEDPVVIRVTAGKM
ncbi:MAG: adenylyl-sulfate kinase [Proteobacteria bacterium]|nr:methyltransferase domain-containing protein [Pseudomonadota bacterium]NOG59078.1 adenylyl-sulfate kinase [Pseudomonadota bacterium]